MSLRLLAGRLLLALLCLVGASRPSCPSACLCVSDTVSCSAGGLAGVPRDLPSFSVTLDLGHNRLSWLGAGSLREMPNLENLRLAHNQLGALGRGAFLNASGLRLLDLSSNRLQAVEGHYFRGLWRLEELLLFDNGIARVEAGALSGLSSLKKAYFSLNRITHFPFFAIRDHSHPFLAMLDLSSNRLARPPWEDVKALPGLVQRGLYLHNNSLVCDCAMYSVFWHWRLRGYDALRDFADEHTCSAAGDPRAPVRFLRPSRLFLDCAAAAAAEETRASSPATVLLSDVLVAEGDGVRLDCQTPLAGADLSFVWLTPGRGFLAQPGPNDTLVALTANGTLEIRAAAANDSGLYVCTALDAKTARNATREVTVTVLPPAPAAESFSTGYTTLLGCVVTLGAILVYLYLTPCRCSCCKQPKAGVMPVATYDPGAVACAFTPSAGEQHKIQISRHVAFIEPMMSEAAAEWIAES